MQTKSTDKLGTVRGWSAVVLVFGAGVLSACQLGKTPMALAAIQHDLDLGIAMASVLVSAFALIGAIGGTPIGLILERTGPKRVIFAGLTMQTLGSAGSAIAQSIELLLAMRALEGLGFLAVVVSAPQLIHAMAPRKGLERAMSLWATSMPVGMTVIMFCSPLADALQWRGFWLLNAMVLSAYALIFAHVMGLPQGVSSDRPILANLKATATTSGPWALAALFGTFSCVFFSVFSLLPLLMMTRFGIDAQTSNTLSGAAIAASAFGNIACGRLMARGVTARRTAMIGFATMATCALGLFTGSTGLASVIALAGILSFASGFIPVVVFREAPAQTVDSGLAGITIGMAMQGNNIGLLIGPAVAGSLFSAFGWPSVAAWTISLSLAAFCLASTRLARSGPEWEAPKA